MNKKVLLGLVGILVIVVFLAAHYGMEENQEPVYTVPAPPVRTEGLTLEEAQEKVQFKILEPEYIPSGFRFVSVYVQEETVMFLYEDDQGRRITVTEWKAPTYEHHLYPGEEEVTINGEKGFFSVPGPYNLLWNCEDVVISLTADLTGGRDSVREEMIRIAQSMEC